MTLEEAKKELEKFVKLKTTQRPAFLDVILEGLEYEEGVRCKDCKWFIEAECVRFADVRPFPEDFCSRAERKEDGLN